jgi:hypothetical protein
LLNKGFQKSARKCVITDLQESVPFKKSWNYHFLMNALAVKAVGAERFESTWNMPLLELKVTVVWWEYKHSTVAIP